MFTFLNMLRLRSVQLGRIEEPRSFKKMNSNTQGIAIRLIGFQAHHPANCLDVGGVKQVKVRQRRSDGELQNLPENQSHGRIGKEKQAAQAKIFQRAVTLEQFSRLRKIHEVLNIQRNQHPTEAASFRGKFHWGTYRS